MDDIQDRIAWNSALNNAVHLLAPNLENSASVKNEVVIRAIEDWQAYFYKNLTQRKQVDRKLASEKGRSDAESDAGIAGEV